MINPLSFHIDGFPFQYRMIEKKWDSWSIRPPRLVAKEATIVGYKRIWVPLPCDIRISSYRANKFWVQRSRVNRGVLDTW